MGFCATASRPLTLFPASWVEGLPQPFSVPCTLCPQTIDDAALLSPPACGCPTSALIKGPRDFWGEAQDTNEQHNATSSPLPLGTPCSLKCLYAYGLTGPAVGYPLTWCAVKPAPPLVWSLLGVRLTVLTLGALSQ